MTANGSLRVVFVTQYYPPEIGAPQNRISGLVRRFAREGSTVTVLTSLPNYPTGQILEGYRGRFYMKESIDGATVHRCWLYVTRSRAFLPRLMNYLSFAFSSFVIGASVLPRSDIVIAESPPLFTGLSAWALAKLKRAKFVLNVADLWVQGAIELGVLAPGLLLRLSTYLERWLYARARLVTGQTKGIVEAIAATGQSRVRLLTNGADLGRYDDQHDGHTRATNGHGSIVGYGGLHGPAQALHTVIDAAVLLLDQPDLKFVLIGDGPVKAELQRRAQERGASNVTFLPPVPAADMPAEMRKWQVGLVSIFDNPVGRSALPSKLFEVMAAGLPVLLAAPSGEASELIESAGAGVAVPPEDPRALADAISRLHRDTPLRQQFGARARECIEARFDRDRIAADYLAELTAVAGRRD